MTLAKSDFALLSQLVELPANERIVVRIEVGCDERASPVDFDAHLLEIRDGQRREILQPVVSFGKSFYFFVFESKTLHDLPLVLEASSLGSNF